MSWQYYINMEPMALEIADEHIKKMTDNHLDKREPCLLNEKYFIPNLKNGFVAATMLVAYCESFINSLIRLEYRDLAKDLYARSTKFKLDRLYDDKGKSDRLKELSDSAAFKHYSTFDSEQNMGIVIANPNIVNNQDMINSLNDQVKQNKYASLNFNYDDINYIIVPNNEKRMDIINFIRNLSSSCFERQNEDAQKCLLISKILVLDEIEKDF